MALQAVIDIWCKIQVRIWFYPEYRQVGYGLRGRSIMRKTLSKEVTFRDGKVIRWREINPPS